MHLKDLKQFLSDKEIRLKKRWGQNFLFDETILRQIVSAADISPDDIVIEVGPGIGTLTEQLLGTGAEVVSVEIDPKLCDMLQLRFAGRERLRVVRQNILDVDLRALFHSCGRSRVKVVANLPYYITSPIIMYFLESGCPIDTLVFTMQEEVARRIVSPPGSKEYGILSVIAQFYAKPSLVQQIKRAAFFPVPQVDSAVVRFDLYGAPPVAVNDRKFFISVVKASFSQRRKTIRNNLLRLAHIDGDAVKAADLLAACRIDPSRRAETLSLEEFASIANWLSAKNHV
jgi:16S rRNA (adenine1518-N6/adenine1519-N6)-dimethyltransferase